MTAVLQFSKPSGRNERVAMSLSPQRMKQSTDYSNPFAAPHASDDCPPRGQSRSRTKSSGIVLVQAFLIFVAVAGGVFDPTFTMMFIVPILTTSLTITVGSVIRREYDVLLFGFSTLAFVAVAAMVIRQQSWSPTQSAYPVWQMCSGYASVALPYAFWVANRKRPVRGPIPETQNDGSNVADSVV